MKRLFPLLSIILAATTAQSEPYCESLLHKETLPKKYAKVAPIFSDVTNGWIFTSDQLKDRYDMKATSQKLVTAIVDEFTKRNVPLAIVVAPPRPIVAGQEQLDSAMGGNLYDVSAARASFDDLIDGLEVAGAIVPNLLNAAMAEPLVREKFYFQRDTHWTTTGAAVSAIALAKSVNDVSPEMFPNDGQFNVQDLAASGSIDEEGSLTEIVLAACEKSLPAETAQTYDLTRSGGLLDETTNGAQIALLGSSFSNRDKRDHYRFADALSRAFDADVENMSVSGGGPIGAIEAYILSGALDRRDHELVIWELPYTESFNSHSFLRQLLGALRKESETLNSVEISMESGSSLVRSLDGSPIAGIEIATSDLSKQSFNLEIRFDNGSTSKVYLGRRNSVPVQLRSKSLSSNLSFFGDRKPLEILVSPLNGADMADVGVY
ncbi:acetyltransferase AlgX (SGNH hydrolase-like protein) [Shimia isoporae]|uniref:Acetyltransferase AlgX (SGNH hydrolase-like protein) n=1 Tax=Shimia isoporae TaxID=647720 RepID=A0A4R1NM79_9RHOB|nr:hypothetical protein [Shimia isoporae]TCL08831.1 acetyltransferase AlgX (SGNH hydrolase-like protein) [Shimia isoporae]